MIDQAAGSEGIEKYVYKCQRWKLLLNVHDFKGWSCITLENAETQASVHSSTLFFCIWWNFTNFYGKEVCIYSTELVRASCSAPLYLFLLMKPLPRAQYTNQYRGLDPPVPCPNLKWAGVCSVSSEIWEKLAAICPQVKKSVPCEANGLQLDAADDDEPWINLANIREK